MFVYLLQRMKSDLNLVNAIYQRRLVSSVLIQFNFKFKSIDNRNGQNTKRICWWLICCIAEQQTSCSKRVETNGQTNERNEKRVHLSTTSRDAIKGPVVVRRQANSIHSNSKELFFRCYFLFYLRLNWMKVTILISRLTDTKKERMTFLFSCPGTWFVLTTFNEMAWLCSK